MGDRHLRLLSLDGGGIRGLSSLYILKSLMENLDHEQPPKPCDVLDLIGGTSTGGYVHFRRPVCVLVLILEGLLPSCLVGSKWTLTSASWLVQSFVTPYSAKRDIE